MANNDSAARAISHWMNVDLFTVEQASALWINVDPTRMKVLDSLNPPECAAIKQILTGGIATGELRADTSTNGFSSIGDHTKSLVSRTDLETFARNRNLFPAFLFDTLSPFERSDPFSLTLRPNLPKAQTPQEATPINRGGRPAQYDWDSFTMEIIRRANLPDGLPDTQAELVREMLSWFQTTYHQEPAESAVKARISKIYKYLHEARNPTA